MTMEEVKGKLMDEMKRILPAQIYGKCGDAVATELTYSIVQLKYANALSLGRSQDIKTTLYNVPEKTEEVLSALMEISKCAPKIIREFMDAVSNAEKETEAGMFVRFPRETVDLHKAAGGRPMGLGFIGFKEIFTAESLRSLAIIAKVAYKSIKTDFGNACMQDVISSIASNRITGTPDPSKFVRHHQMFAEAAIEAKESKYIEIALDSLMRLIESKRFIIMPDRPGSEDGFDGKDIIKWSKSCGKFLGLVYTALANDEFLTYDIDAKLAALHKMNQIIADYGLSDRKICKIFRALCATNRVVTMEYVDEVVKTISGTDAEKIKGSQKEEEAIRYDFRTFCIGALSEGAYLDRIRKY
ncbi:MAG: hypothetical protein NTX79_02150 [Candidatus Micrarchaeota archaeon]|nr:hypothetical protein [Candidatus Micrarchaeota archaeon]